MNRIVLWLLVTLITGLFVGEARNTCAADATPPPQPRTWKTVNELSPDELREVDLSTDMPRSAVFSYVPIVPLLVR